MKRIFFTQQKNLNINYLPLRWGLGQYTDEQIQALIHMFKPDAPDSPAKCCRKMYTTRTHPLSGEYYVVEGSRFKAKPVEPRIEFAVAKVWELNLKTEKLHEYGIDDWLNWEYSILNETAPFRPHYTFPELDLGIKGATFEQLRDELLGLNPKATIDTPFYVSKHELVGARE